MPGLAGWRSGGRRNDRESVCQRFFPNTGLACYCEHEAVFGMKAAVHCHEVREATDEETGTDEKKEGESNLTGDENVAQAALSAAARLTVAIAKSSSDSGGGRLKRRGEAGENSGKQGDES